jgi:hypothetical protein
MLKLLNGVRSKKVNEYLCLKIYGFLFVSFRTHAIPRFCQRINIQIQYVRDEKFLIVVVERTAFYSPRNSLRAGAHRLRQGKHQVMKKKDAVLLHS